MHPQDWALEGRWKAGQETPKNLGSHLAPPSTRHKPVLWPRAA